MQKTRVPTLPWEEIHSPTRKFHSFFRNLSLALGGIRNVGTWGGGHPFDVQIRRVPPGAAVCPFHVHLAQWEMFVVLAGSGAVRVGEATHPVKTHDVFVHPPGEAHQLLNPGAADLEVLIVADNPPLDAFYYPDSRKWGLRPLNAFFRAVEADYFDGEDSASAATGQPFTLPPRTEPFRKLNLDELPWEEWHSPQKKFRGFSKELSIALGAKRNTPTGLGGHPFDLELQRLGPGECGCPFHAHAAEWELFYIVEGRASVRAGAETHALTAGDVVLHPPGEAHQITNASSAEDLVFFLVADNAPVEYWHYPDSGKWGLRSPRTFFRAAEADYWDGEE